MAKHVKHFLILYCRNADACQEKKWHGPAVVKSRVLLSFNAVGVKLSPFHKMTPARLKKREETWILF